MRGTTAFDDRTVTLSGAPEQLAGLGALMSAPTRLAVLATLVRAGEPLHINELARRVGVDASPVRTHLELLARAGLVAEVADPGAGRERRFEARVRDVRLTLEGVNAPPRRPGPVPRTVDRLQKKLEGLEKDRRRLEEKAREIQGEIEAAWAKGS